MKLNCLLLLKGLARSWEIEMSRIADYSGLWRWTCTPGIPSVGLTVVTMTWKWKASFSCCLPLSRGAGSQTHPSRSLSQTARSSAWCSWWPRSPPGGHCLIGFPAPSFTQSDSVLVAYRKNGLRFPSLWMALGDIHVAISWKVCPNSIRTAEARWISAYCAQTGLS